MDGFDPGHICNHSDHQGRYAYGRQPNVAYWNLYCLAQALASLIDDQEMTLQVLEGYKTLFPRYLGDAMRAKLGLVGDLAPESEREADWTLVEDLMQLMAAEKVDFTVFWRQLSQAVVQQSTLHALTDAGWSAVTDLGIGPPSPAGMAGAVHRARRPKQLRGHGPADAAQQPQVRAAQPLGRNRHPTSPGG
jgi:serine/tyrosine/threonine adenylyltransferase